MKIDSTGKVTGTYATQPKPARSSTQTAEAAQSSSDESVSINPLLASQTSEPPFNADKVARIKADIAAGRYTIDPKNIANGLLDDVRELLGR